MANNKISPQDSSYLDTMRGISILRVMLAHLGLSWFFSPYSEFTHVLLPILFFVSGAILFHSFHRAPSTPNFLIRRAIATYIPYLLLIIGAFLVLWAFETRIPQFNTYEFLQWITLNPLAVHETMPFPLHQAWYLHALLLMIFISPFFFKPGKKQPLFLLIPVVASLAISVFQLYYDIGHNLYIFEHNIYQALANMGFFFFGAFFYSNKHLFTRNIIYILAACSLVIGAFTGIFIVTNINMYKHTYAPDMYFVSLSYFVIFMFLMLQGFIERLTSKITFLDTSFKFMSKHSFSIYLLHSLVLIKVHTWLNLSGVADSPALAALKIFLVISITCIISVPFTKLCKITITALENRLFNNNEYAAQATASK